MSPIVPFARYRLQLRLHHSVRLHFRHEVMLHSLLSEALGRGELPEGVIPFACESGRVDFEAGDDYRLGFTIAGERPEERVAAVAGALGVYGGRGFQGHGIPMLRWFSVGAPESLPAPSLDTECAALTTQQELVLQFVSPLRLEIPGGRHGRGARGDEGEQFFDAAHFPAGHFLRLLWNRLFFLAEGRFPHREESESGLPDLPSVDCDPRQLLWVDVPRPRKPPLGGVVGRVAFRNPGAAWLPLLVAGQFLHVGKSTGYGLGRYAIVNGRSLWNDPFAPSVSVLERVAGRERLLAAARHVASSTEAGGSDGVGPEQFARDESAIVGGIARSLADGSYRAAPLLGILLPKEPSGVRALAVPTLTDRTVQRAALEVIGPAVETLLEDCSYAYRKGFSRAGAARAIQVAYADGYRWVLDADIESFFDAVPWERLFGKLEALYPFEPLTALLRAWVSAPVVFKGMTIERTQGLPQGAVISPLLANLYLDELDEELLGADFRLVRYADDFVVLCKDARAAEEARDRARAALARLGLSLQEEKTAIRSVDHGFSYLGYLFCRSVAVEAHESHDAEGAGQGMALAAGQQGLHPGSPRGGALGTQRAQPSPSGRGQGEGSDVTSSSAAIGPEARPPSVSASDVHHQRDQSVAVGAGRGAPGPQRVSQPSPSGRGQGEGSNVAPSLAAIGPEVRASNVPHPPDLQSSAVAPASWLARIDPSRLRALPSPGGGAAEAPQVVPLLRAGIPAGGDTRRPLYIADPSVELHLRKETVVVAREGETPREVPLRALSHVVFIGTRRATLPLVLELGLAGVPAFFCRGNGELEAVHGPFEPDVEAWLAQGNAARQEPVRLAFAQEIVAAKLHNTATIAVRHRLEGWEAAADQIRVLERSVWNQTTVDSVRGLEGAAAAVYFGSVAASLPAEWGFKGRVKHPPEGPFNALLSYGYTLLYHHCAAALYAAGLLPRIGLFHVPHGAWQAAASDLQEELRYVVDGLVWSLVKRREIRPDAFDHSGEGCWLLPDARRRFIETFEERMETTFTPREGERAMTYREAIAGQASRLREYVLGRGRYEAIRTH